MADYDAGDITDRERLAAKRQKDLAVYNARSVGNQLDQQLANYDMANKQNRRLADVQVKQNQRKTEDDRFEAYRNLQNATIGLLGSMNQAMNGSSVGNLLRMLQDRNDADNQTYWSQHQTNIDAVNNAYEESFNQNNMAKRDAISNADKALRDIQSDLSANLNNINPNLYESPEGKGKISAEQDRVARLNRDTKAHNALLSGYLMPETAEQAVRQVTPRNRLRNTDYYGRLMNRFNGRL